MFCEFLEDLFSHGRVRVPAPDSSQVDDAQAVRHILTKAEEARRTSLPSNLPGFDVDVAVWAARCLYDAARFLVYRDVAADVIPSHLQPRKPEPTTASEHYSADLCLHFMNDVLRLSKAAADNDPLNENVRRLLTDWPLSAVGTGNAKPASVRSPVWSDMSLRLVYLDRIIRLNDRQLFSANHVREELVHRMGAWTRLLPAGIRQSEGTSLPPTPFP